MANQSGAASQAFIKARRNPFSMERLHALGCLMPEHERSLLRQKLEACGRRGAVVGPRGSGKTTLLAALAEDLRKSGQRVKTLRLSADSKSEASQQIAAFTAAVRPEDFVLLDGAEQMSFVRWLYFRFQTRRVTGLIVTTHRHGRLPCLIELHPSAALLAEIISVLVELPAAESEEIAVLYHNRHHGNLRDALRAMYDDFPNLTAPITG